MGNDDPRGFEQSGGMTPIGTIVCGSAMTTSAASAMIKSIGDLFMGMKTQSSGSNLGTKKNA